MSQDKPIEELTKLFHQSESTVDLKPKEWLRSVRDKLYSMFCSPMKEEYTHEAFNWVAHLCMSIGDFSWISPDDTWSCEEVRIFSCIARLALNEVHILLPPIQRHLTCGDDPEVEDNKVLARSATSEDYERFGNHLVMLESIIKSLVKGQKDDGDTNQLVNSIRSDELKSMLERLKETVTIICEYLELVHQRWRYITDGNHNLEMSAAEAAVRIMSVWLSEEPFGFESQCKRFLIDLITKNLLYDGRSCRDDLLVMALHSICTQDEELSETFKAIPEHKSVLENYLRYVQREQRRSESESIDNRVRKLFKLRCGLVKDLMSDTKATEE